MFVSYHAARKRSAKRFAHRAWTLLLFVSLLGMTFLPPIGAQVARAAPPPSPHEAPVAEPAPAPQPAPEAQAADPATGPIFRPPVKEVAEERSAYSRTRPNPDGSVTTTLSQRPMHWKDSKGRWQEFRNELALSQAPGFGQEGRGNGYSVRFGKPADVAAGRPLLSLSAEGKGIGVSAPGAAPKGVAVAGKAVTLTDAYPGGVDVRFTLDNERVKEDIVLNRAPAAGESPSFRFLFDLEGVTAAKQADGSILFREDGGHTLFRIPAFFLQDATGDPKGYSGDVSVTLTQDGPGRASLVVEPDAAWLRDPARAYPVVLDPTFETFTGGFQPANGTAQNVGIGEAAGPINHYGAESHDVGKYDNGMRKDVLIQFPDVSRLPQDSAVTGAALRLYAGAGEGNPGIMIGVHRNTGPWKAETATWDSAPTVDGTRLAFQGGLVGAWNVFDITEAARAWVRGDWGNHGLRLLSNGGPSEYVHYLSSFTANEALRPELTISYVRASRYGVNRLWNYTSHDHGGGTTSHVNTSTGNAVVTHSGGSIAARGYSVGLTHVYNAQDPHYQTGLYKGADYGEGWSFAESMRLYEIAAKDGLGNEQPGRAVIFKDGSASANRVYVRDADANGTRTYHSPLYYDWTLTKDVKATPTDPLKVWMLRSQAGDMRLYFDADGRLTRKQDRKGNSLTYGYSVAGPNGKLTRITDVAGRSTVLEYADPTGRLSKITDMAGRIHTYEYVGGNLTTVKHAYNTTNMTTTVYGYDDAHQLTSVRNPRGHTSYIRYGDKLETWEAAGATGGWVAEPDTAATGVSHATATARSGTGTTGVLRVSMAGATFLRPGTATETLATAEAYNSVPQELVAWVYVPATGVAQLYGRLVLGYQTGQEVGAARGDNRVAKGPLVALNENRWVAVKMPNAQVDPAWRVQKLSVQVMTAEGASTSYTGDVYVDELFVKGIAASVTDAKATPNAIARYSYDWAPTLTVANKTTVSRPNTAGGSASVVFSHDRSGQVTRTQDPSGVATDGKYDEFLRLVEVTPVGGDASTYSISYYPNSNEANEVTNKVSGEKTKRGADAGTGDTTYALDPLNFGRRESGGAFDLAVPEYDAAGNVLSAATRRYAASTQLDANAPSGGTVLRETRYTYGAGGTVTSMTPPECARKAATEQAACRTEFTYQATGTGYLTEISAPAGAGETSRRVTAVVPRSDGTPSSATDPKGNKTTYEYDTLGRLKKINYGMQDNIADHSVSYTLDANGNMTAMTDKAGSSSWTYDENNRVTRESRTQNGATKATTYAYHANGLLQSQTTYGGQTVSYTYDAGMRLVSQTDPKDPNASKTITYGYDGRGRRTTITYPSGVQQKVRFDPDGRVDVVSLLKGTATIQSFDYDYGLSYGAGGAVTRSAAYHKGNVVGVAESTPGVRSASLSYEYDEFDRLTRELRTGTPSFDQRFGYDLNDNRTSVTKSGTTTTATYDPANALIRETTGTAVKEYGYDRNGSMTSFGPSGAPNQNTMAYDAANKWTSGNVSGKSISHGYDGHGRRASRTTGTARTDYWHDMGGMSLESSSTGAPTATYLRDPGGRPLSISINGTHFMNYGTDRLGSVTANTDGSGNLANSYAWDAWGENVGVSGQTYQPLFYTGTYNDHETGFYQMGARYYGAGMGRFTQMDPRPSSVVEANRYQYAGCDPANNIDPTGLNHTSCSWSVAALIASVLSNVTLFIPILGIPLTVILTAFGAGVTGVQLVHMFEEDASNFDKALGFVSFISSFPVPHPIWYALDVVSAYGVARTCGVL